ncbi:hypothetical protein Tco_0828017 [Tanacetum coccineum]
MEGNAGAASANSASAEGNGGGEDDASGDNGDCVSDGDGGAAVHSTIAARVIKKVVTKEQKRGTSYAVAGRADLAVSDLAKIQVIPAYNIHECRVRALIVGSSRIPTIPCLIADSLALRALSSARDIVVKGALIAQW